jgi:4-diphosphocytidyl-2-C-methyl-D-erythritol kinase
MSDAELNTRVVAAPAKINPFLRVLGRRDDGFHELETLILPVSLADEVRVHAYADPSMFRTLSFGLDVTGEPALTRGVPVDETNLALRAAAALAEAVGPKGFADIVLDKRVPAAAGLGGGSSDAAAVLTALNDLWGSALSLDALAEIGARVGSDVPALLSGMPTLARGRGERVQPAAVAEFEWVLVAFPFGVRTKDAFEWWDADGAPTGPEPWELLEALSAGDATGAGPLLFNDLEASVIARHPEIGRAKGLLLAEEGVAGVVMCGSGASLAGLVHPGIAGVARAVERRLAELDAAVTVTSVRSASPVTAILADEPVGEDASRYPRYTRNLAFALDARRTAVGSRLPRWTRSCRRRWRETMKTVLARPTLPLSPRDPDAGATRAPPPYRRARDDRRRVLQSVLCELVPVRVAALDQFDLPQVPGRFRTVLASRRLIAALMSATWTMVGC